MKITKPNIICPTNAQQTPNKRPTIYFMPNSKIAVLGGCWAFVGHVGRLLGTFRGVPNILNTCLSVSCGGFWQIVGQLGTFRCGYMWSTP